MTLLGGLLAVVLLVLAGSALLRALGPATWPFGIVGFAASGFVAGAASLSLITTLLAVVGASVRVWLTAPLVAVVLVGSLARIRRRGLPIFGGLPVERSADAAGLLTMLAGVPLLLTASVQHMTENDEFSIWAWKGRALDAVGRVDTFLLATDPAHQFANRDYPLMLPSLQIWGNGWLGGPSERMAHVLVALLTLSALVVAVTLIARTGGAFVAIVGLLLVLSVRGFLAQATFFMGDAPTAMLALALLLSVVFLGHDRAGDERDRERGDTVRAAGVVAIVAAAAAVMTKNEGTVFVIAVLLAAVLLSARGRRRLLIAPALAALVAVLPWAIWSRAHGLESDFANSKNLRVGVLRDHADRLPHILDRVAFYWPGLPWLLLGVALLVSVGAAVFKRDRALLLPVVGGLLALAALVLVELLAEQETEAFYRFSLPRILLFPAAAFGISGIMAAGRLLGRQDRGTETVPLGTEGPETVRRVAARAGNSS